MPILAKGRPTEPEWVDLAQGVRLLVKLHDPVAEHAAWMAHIEARRADPNDLVAASWAEKMALAKRVVVGWEGIQEADGTPAPFSPENLRRLLEDGLDDVGMSMIDVFWLVYLAAKDRWRREGNGSGPAPGGTGSQAAG